MGDISNQAMQDYLKVVFDLCQEEGRATTGAVADRLQVAPSSVTGMFKKLSTCEPPLLDYRKRWGAVLTDAGEREALGIIRRHRLLERFLHDFLGYRWEEVHDEAERLEHAVTAELAERIAKVLDDPQYDPHGDPIPSRDLELPSANEQSLRHLTIGRTATVTRVGDREPELLRYLQQVGLIPGTSVTVVERIPFGDGFHIRVGDEQQAVQIGSRAAAEVYVADGDDTATEEA